jgi:hypothetical protein
MRDAIGLLDRCLELEPQSKFVLRALTVKLLRMTAMSKEPVRDLYQKLQRQQETTHKYLA